MPGLRIDVGIEDPHATEQLTGAPRGGNPSEGPLPRDVHLAEAGARPNDEALGGEARAPSHLVQARPAAWVARPILRCDRRAEAGGLRFRIGAAHGVRPALGLWLRAGRGGGRAPPIVAPELPLEPRDPPRELSSVRELRTGAAAAAPPFIVAMREGEDPPLPDPLDARGVPSAFRTEAPFRFFVH